jgi:hypothetical protein
MEPVEARTVALIAVVLLALAALFVFLPEALAYPAALVFVWFTFALLYKAAKIRRQPPAGSSRRQ